MRLQRADNGGRIYRKLSYGPMLDIVVLDMRSYRSGNDDNLAPTPEARTAFLGQAQLDWLKSGLKGSQAQWKVIAADMPIGLGVPDGEVSPGVGRWEAIANGDDGAAKGRELEIAELLGFLRQQKSPTPSGSRPMCTIAQPTTTIPTALRFRTSSPSGSSSPDR